MNAKVINCDLVIVGAGIAGAALACALGDSALRVVVIEAQSLSLHWPEQQSSPAGFDSRVSALTPKSQAFLAQLGVWREISQRRVCAYQKMHVWDANGTGSIDFNAQEINQPALGYIVENRLTVAALLSRATQYKNVQLIDAIKESTLRTSTKSATQQLVLDNGDEIHCALVVAADGANSSIRTQANFAMREWDYGHQALVATVETEHSHQNTAWQRFMHEGPLAFLPLQADSADKHFCSIVWSVQTSVAEGLMALNDHEFMQTLSRSFEGTLGEIRAVSRRLSFPLRQRHAVDYIQPGVVLVADAAHTIHPLAGQGINLGLLDVRALAAEILRAQQRDLNIGDLRVLSRFQRQRKANNLMMMASMEGFKRLFEQKALSISWARNAGMLWLNNNQYLKHRLMREVIGL